MFCTFITITLHLSTVALQNYLTIGMPFYISNIFTKIFMFTSLSNPWTL